LCRSLLLAQIKSLCQSRLRDAIVKQQQGQLSGAALPKRQRKPVVDLLILLDGQVNIAGVDFVVRLPHNEGIFV